ncbi:MAG: PAS domain S-box protein, partial [Candidatus Limnocylindrales bacterium]
MPSEFPAEISPSSIETEDGVVATAALAAAEERFRSAFDGAPIGMALVSPDGRFVRVNASLCEILGRDERALLSSTFQEITHPDDLEADLAYVRQVLAGERRSYQTEKRYLHGAGNIVWAKLSVSLVRDEQGQPLHFIAQIEDVTAAKATEEALRHSEAKLRAIIDNVPASIALRGVDGRLELVNNQVARVLGVAAEDVVGRSLAEFFDAETVAVMREQDARMVADVAPTVEELEFADADGSQRTHHVVRYPITDADGTLTGLGSFSLDITERKQIEVALRARERQLQEAQSLARFGSFELDLSNGSLQWSDELCRIFGREPGNTPTYEEFVAQVHPDDLAAFQQNAALARQGQFTDSGFRIIRPDGQIRHVYTR